MTSLSVELSRIVAAAENLLQRVGEDESRKPVRVGGWSRKQVIGHLIDSASNNHQRFVRAALQSSLEFPAYDQEGWVRIQAAEEVPWTVLVGLWAHYNRFLAHVISQLPSAKQNTICRIGDNDPVALRFLVEDYVRHLVHHLKQVGAAERSPE